MDWKEYIEQAKVTESHVEELNISEEFLIAALNLNALSAELLDCIKKLAFYNNPQKLEDNIVTLLKKMQLELSLIKNYNTQPRDLLYGEDAVKPQVNTRIAHSLIGIITEAGELSEAFEKGLSAGEFDIVNLKEEFFDMDWYKAIGSDEMNIDWGEGWQNNIDKLQGTKTQKGRYSDGYNDQDANNRDLDSEREILEGRKPNIDEKGQPRNASVSRITKNEK